MTSYLWALVRHVHAARSVSVLAAILVLALSAALPGNAAHAAVVCPNATIEEGYYTSYETPHPGCSLGFGSNYLAFQNNNGAMATWLWQGGDYVSITSVSGANCSVAGNIVVGQVGATCTAVWNWGTGNTATMTFTANAGAPYNSATVTSLIFTGGAFGGSLQTPTLTSISPSQGPAAGGTPVTITGTDFLSATKVSFGSTDVSAANFTSLSDTQIVVNAPAGSGTVNVSVNTAGGTTTDPGTANDFTYIAPPHITATWSPTSILANGAATSQLVLNLNNLNSSTLTQVSIANSVLPAGLRIQTAPVTTCGGTTSGSIGGTSFGLAGGTLAANGFCQVALDVVANVATTSTFVSGVASALESGAGGSGATSIPLTSTAVATTIEGVSGFGQSAPLNSQFAAPLVVRVRDFAGNPMPGAEVIFIPPASGASAILSTPSLTDSDGKASVTATANGTSGNYAVSAFVLGGPGPVVFVLRNDLLSQTITFTSTPPANAAVGGTPYTVAATATSMLPVSFSIAPVSAAVCSINGTQVSFIGEGTCVINADQAGDANHTAAATVQQSITVVDTKTPQAKAIGGYMSERANQIVTNQFDAGRQIDRLQQAGQQQGDGGSGQFAANGTQTSLAASGETRMFSRPGIAMAGANQPLPGPLDLFGLQSILEGWRASGDLGHLQYSGLFDLDADVSRGFEGTFKASLSDMIAWTDRQQAALGLGQGSAGATALAFDLWVEGVYANYDGDSDGRFGMITIGADYVFSPSFLAGVYAQYDNTEETGTDQIDGEGWMIGPYATARLGENVFWHGRAAWGQSSNDIVVGASSGAFDSTRWLVSSELTGRWQLGNGITFSPAASFSWFEDRAESYVDSNSVTVPGVTSRLGQLRLSPELGYGFETADGLWIEPRISPELLWNVASARAAGLGSLGGTAAGPDGVRGRVTAGLVVRAPNGLTVTANGSFDGIGLGDDYHAISGTLGVSLPF